MNAIRQKLKDIPEKMPMVLSRGINRTLLSTRAETVRQIRPIMPVTQREMRSRIRIYNSTRAHLRGKLWVGGKDMPLSRFGAKQTTRTHLVATTPAQALWLYYNVFKKKYGPGAKFSWHYKIKRRLPIVTYNLGQGRQTLEPAWIVKIRNFDHVMMKKGATPAGLIINAYGMVFVNNEKLLNQMRSTFTGLQMFATRLLIKNIEDQVQLALAS